MTDRQFEDAWRLGHIEFLGSAWGARPDYFRRLRTQPYKAGTGWQRTRTAEAPRSTERDAAVPDLRRAIFDPLKHPSGGEKLRALAAINDLLSPPAQLAGVFLPPGRDPSFDFIILGEMPSMNEPSGTAANSNFNFNVTAGDRFLQQMVSQHGIAGTYITDIVKQRAAPGRPSAAAIKAWLPFLEREIEIIQPKGLIVLGRTNFRVNFMPFVHPSLPAAVDVDWVFHYSQVPRNKFEARFSELISRMRNASRSHR